MGIFDRYINKPGPGIPKDKPKKKGMALFFEILWREFWTLLKLNMLFLVFCIPVVTIPAAITAMSRITLTMMRDKNHFLFRDFFSCFKKEFLKSLGAGAIVFVIMALSAFGVWFYTSLEALGWLRMIPAAIGAGCFIIILLMGNYIFAQIAYLEVPFGKMFKNAFYLVFVCIKRNLIVLVINAILLGLGIGMLPYSLPAFIMIIFSLANFVAMFHAYPAMQKYLEKPEEKPNEFEQAGKFTSWQEERDRIAKAGRQNQS